MSAIGLPYGVCDAYLMRWPDGYFVKVGITRNERWRAFMNRGAELMLVYRTSTTKAMRIERHALDVLGKLLDPVFRDRNEAAPWIGCRGAGWTECFIDDGTAPVCVFAASASRYEASAVEVIY